MFCILKNVCFFVCFLFGKNIILLTIVRTKNNYNSHLALTKHIVYMLLISILTKLFFSPVKAFIIQYYDVSYFVLVQSSLIHFEFSRTHYILSKTCVLSLFVWTKFIKDFLIPSLFVEVWYFFFRIHPFKNN